MNEPLGTLYLKPRLRIGGTDACVILNSQERFQKEALKAYRLNFNLNRQAVRISSYFTAFLLNTDSSLLELFSVLKQVQFLVILD